MPASTPPPPAKHHIPPIMVGLLVVFAFVYFFTSALHDPQPRDVKLGIVGSTAATAQLQTELDHVARSGFTVRRYQTESAAARAIRHQNVQGAFIPDARKPQLLIASADGFAISDLLQQVFTASTAAVGEHLAIHDLVPLPAHDSKGLSPFLTIAGITVGSLIFSVALFILTFRTRVHRRFLTIVLFATLAGILGAIDTHYVADGLGGPFWPVAGILALVSGAVALTTAAVIRLVGSPGIGICLVVLAFFALPGSGGPLGYEFLPAFYHSIAQALPSTAGVSALRGAVYFAGHGTLDPILVLIAWVVGAVLLYAIATFIREHPHPPFSLHGSHSAEHQPDGAQERQAPDQISGIPAAG